MWYKAIGLGFLAGIGWDIQSRLMDHYLDALINNTPWLFMFADAAVACTKIAGN